MPGRLARLGHHPFKVEIKGSKPLRGTTSIKLNSALSVLDHPPLPRDKPVRPIERHKVRIRSLSPAEQELTDCLDVGPDSAKAVIDDAVALFFTWAVQEDLVSVRRRVMVQTQGIGDYGANLSKPEVNEPSPAVRPSHRDRTGTANIRSPKLVVISPS